MIDQHEADAGGNGVEKTGADGTPAKAGDTPRSRRVAPAPPDATLTPPPGFEDAARAVGVEFDAGDVERLGRYLALLLDENTRVNRATCWTR